VDEERSYATRTGQANGDMGWIRLVAYREVEPQVWWQRQQVRPEEGNRRDLDGSAKRDAQAPAPSTQAAPKAQSDLRSNSQGGQTDESNPGTGWGQSGYDPVRETQFVAQRWASDQITLRYEYANGLRALGIVPRRSRLNDREHGQLGFAQAPRW